MKRKNRIKKLKARQNAYDKLRSEVKDSMRRPGSQSK